MGIYETLYADCPNCGIATSVQTKIGKCEMLSITVGEKFEFKEDNCLIASKEKCHLCKGKIIIKIEDGKFMGFTKDVSPKYIEKLYGKLKEVNIK